MLGLRGSFCDLLRRRVLTLAAVCVSYSNIVGNSRDNTCRGCRYSWRHAAMTFDHRGRFERARSFVDSIILSRHYFDRDRQRISLEYRSSLDGIRESSSMLG